VINRSERGVFIDFILLWSASITVLKFGLSGHISAEFGGLLLMAVLLVVVFTRVAGSNVFREKSRLPKFSLSLACFALSVADGDVHSAMYVAALTAALPICLFGLYICFRSAFGKI
jgi:hypothetical protein